ncbi:hypothetical protein [Agarivorans sp. DSG3-1]|uniref:hypothetical protein n=1 Tax=Agarivorans sp. DSG3-1 TaxID=3342249 RepID=UPI00398F1389
MIVEKSKEELTTWRGKYDFFFLTKIEAILSICELKSDEHCIFLDTDTACVSDLEAIATELDKGVNYLHKKEYELGTPKLKGNAKAISDGTLGQTFAEQAVIGSSAMWNSGVVAIAKNNQPAKVMQKAKAICEAMLDSGLRQTFIEQLSIALAVTSSGKTLEAEPLIKHYWGNKEPWDQLAYQFLAEIRLRNISLAESVAHLDKYPLDMPAYVKEPKLEKLKNSIKKRLPSI